MLMFDHRYPHFAGCGISHRCLSLSAPALNKTVRTEIKDGVGIVTFDNPNLPVSEFE